VLERDDLTPIARMVGVHLAMRMNVKSQSAWPNIATVGRALGFSHRHVSRAISELEAGKALLVIRHAGRGSRYFLWLPIDP
jgi:DNA-binding transcriptional regulator GbsR (MarR family)